jgi:hypothetical protein
MYLFSLDLKGMGNFADPPYFPSTPFTLVRIKPILQTVVIRFAHVQKERIDSFVGLASLLRMRVSTNKLFSRILLNAA